MLQMCADVGCRGWGLEGGVLGSVGRGNDGSETCASTISGELTGKERLWREIGVLGTDGRMATVDDVAAAKQQRVRDM